MDRFEVLLYPQAYRDIDEIYAYISLKKQAPENAESQTGRIWEALQSLEIFPERHQERLYGRYAGKGYRQLMIDNYAAIFKIDAEGKKVFVVTVQYGGHNL